MHAHPLRCSRKLLSRRGCEFAAAAAAAAELVVYVEEQAATLRALLLLYFFFFAFLTAILNYQYLYTIRGVYGYRPRYV